MKIQVLSDLHVEINGPHDLGDHCEADLLIIAGDTNSKGLERTRNTIDLMTDHLQNTMVFYIAGNHEFYKTKLDKELKSFDDGMFFLDNKIVNLKNSGGNVSLIGSTLWSDILPDKRFLATTGMNDYNLIRLAYSNYRKLNPDDTSKYYHINKIFIEDALKATKHNKQVVVTHHAPSFKSIDSKYKNDKLNSCFASNLEKLIEEYQPELWIHGHTHNFSDYMIGKTRVVCNPKGYTFYGEDTGFKNDFIVEI